MAEKKRCFGVVDPVDRAQRLVDDIEVFLELGKDEPAAVEADLTQAHASLDALSRASSSN